jgi:hypothetical protein
MTSFDDGIVPLFPLAVSPSVVVFWPASGDAHRTGRKVFLPYVQTVGYPWYQIPGYQLPVFTSVSTVGPIQHPIRGTRVGRKTENTTISNVPKKNRSKEKQLQRTTE